MALEDRKATILNCVGLGLSYAQAEILAECTAEETELLDKDEAFQARVKFKAESLKRTLLERVLRASEMNEAYGSTTETRWLLEKLDKERFGSGKGNDTPSPDQATVTVYLPDNGRDRV